MFFSNSEHQKYCSH